MNRTTTIERTPDSEQAAAEVARCPGCGGYSDACYCGAYSEEWSNAPPYEPLPADVEIDRYPTLAERLAESVKDDWLP